MRAGPLPSSYATIPKKEDQPSPCLVRSVSIFLGAEFPECGSCIGAIRWGGEELRRRLAVGPKIRAASSIRREEDTGLPRR